MKDYFKTLEYLYGLEKLGIVFGLDNIEWLLSLIGNPERSFRSVHVGGTNGKGSVAAMLSAILGKAAYRAGLYTSPHLLSFTERIVVDAVPITEKEVVEITRYIKERVDAKDPNRKFTFFDFTTALAFEYFRRKQVEIAVVEVGLGGRLDSTNVLQPIVSVITNVAADHTDYLGDTIEAIAGEKAGIIKEGVPAVTGTEGAALDVIRASAAEKATLYVLGEHFHYDKQGEQRMSYRGIERDLDDVRVGLLGDHQLFNTAIALAASEIVGFSGFNLPEQAIREGLAALKWPGRLELIGEKPMILLDAAHNLQGAEILASFLKTRFSNKRKVLVFGVMKDKDFKGMLAALTPFVDQTILTQPSVARAASPHELVPYATGAVVTDSVAHALIAARKAAHEDDLIIVTGSFYTLGEVKELLEKICNILTLLLSFHGAPAPRPLRPDQEHEHRSCRYCRAVAQIQQRTEHLYCRGRRRDERRRAAPERRFRAL